VLKKTARILILKLMARQEKIGGNGMIVEIDESKFGKRKYNRGHRVEGVWILGMIEKTGQKRIRLVTLKQWFPKWGVRPFGGGGHFGS
jgi:hypothetical protein